MTAPRCLVTAHTVPATRRPLLPRTSGDRHQGHAATKRISVRTRTTIPPVATIKPMTTPRCLVTVPVVPGTRHALLPTTSGDRHQARAATKRIPVRTRTTILPVATIKRMTNPRCFVTAHTVPGTRCPQLSTTSGDRHQAHAGDKGVPVRTMATILPVARIKSMTAPRCLVTAHAVPGTCYAQHLLRSTTHRIRGQTLHGHDRT